MRNESVAILDIRSSEVSFSLGAKGVNGTFVFSNSRTERYEGILKGSFLDLDSFRSAVTEAVNAVRKNYGGKLGEIFVGVPSSFIFLYTKGHTLSFPRKRKISVQDVDALYASGWDGTAVNSRCIRRSNMYFSLGDNRKYFAEKELYGTATNSLKGGLCYYCVSEEFYQTVNAIMAELGFSSVRFIPSTLAQAVYLISEQKREGYAFLLDVGYLTSSLTVVYGNGIVREETFDFGVGSVLVALMENFGVDFATAEEILYAANISGGSIPNDFFWTNERGDLRFKVCLLNDVIKCALDGLCEQIDEFFAKYYKDKNVSGLSVNPISLTGEGIVYIKGMAEHISKRISRLTEVVVPDLPYFDKPTFSSRIALLNMAIEDKQVQSWWKRIFNGFGGKNK